MEQNKLDGRIFGKLTNKQRKTLDLIRAGMTSKEVARILGVSPHTVDQRVASVRKKLGLSSRRALIGFCLGLPEKEYEQAVYQFPYVETKCETDHDNSVGSALSKVFLSDDHIAIDGPTGIKERAQSWIEGSLGCGYPTLKEFKSTLAVLVSCAVMIALMYSAARVLMDLIASLI